MPLNTAILKKFNSGSSTANAVSGAKKSTFVKYDPNIKGSGSFFGNLGRSIFSSENIDTAIKSGISIAATKLSANASKGSEQNAIAYEAQKAQTAAAEELAANAKKAAAEAGATGSTPKWVLPVGIGAGVLVLGTIVYFIVKK